ncbi:hypothetical protein BDV18DRAFT_142690 [Aspergillus unguis]
MARFSNYHVSVRQSIVMLLTILTANASSNHGMSRHHRRADADTSSGSSQKCSGTGLPDNFSCSASSTCISIDGGSSVICCPEGQDCSYIQPITCDVTKQNATLHPDNVIKTTRLDDDLPTCGNACCPFGYTCQGNFCAMDDTASSTSSQTESTSSSITTSTSQSEESTASSTTTSEPSTEPSADSTESATESATESQTTIEPQTTTSTTAETTTDPALSIADDLSTVTVVDSSATTPTPTLSSYSAASSNNLSAAEANCSAFPTNAVLAGFFPGAIFGAVAALLVAVCIRRHRKNNLPPGEKVLQNTFRKSTGTLIGISDPIPSDDSSYRTDFLLGTNPKRQSEGSRSVLSRSRTRVKSLFSTSPRAHAVRPQEDDIPAVPPVPALLSLPGPRTPPPRERQPSTESIRVYTPPGAFANVPTLNPSPYPTDQRPNTTLTEILDRAQAQMQAESAPASGANSKADSNSNATDNTTQRFLLPPPQKLGRRKQLPY